MAQEKATLDGYFTEDLKTMLHEQLELEFKNNFSRWQKFVKAANLEKKWMDERLRWFFTPQTVLFAFFGLTYSNNIPQNNTIIWLRCIVASLGVLTSICVYGAVASAARMHWLWHIELSEIFNKYKNSK